MSSLANVALIKRQLKCKKESSNDKVLHCDSLFFCLHYGPCWSGFSVCFVLFRPASELSSSSGSVFVGLRRGVGPGSNPSKM